MGLDLYIYKVSKPDLSPTQQYLEEALKKQGYQQFTTSDLKDDSAYEQLLPYSVSVCVERTAVDLDQMAHTFHLVPDSMLPIVIGSDRTVLSGVKQSDGKPYSITLTEDMAGKFTKKIVEPCHVYLREQVVWLHGHEEEELADALQNYMYEHFQVENCKYCKLSAKNVRDINDLLPYEPLLELDPAEESGYFYLEWY